MLAVLFSSAGYEVHQASNGIEALKIHRRHPVDVMIVELVLPEKDGFEMLMDLRSQACMPKFIAVTGGGKFPMQDCLRAAKQLGAHQVLTKPFQLEHLLAAVNQLVGAHKQNPPHSRGAAL
jgi:DNA-binding response OmpR family regulator